MLHIHVCISQLTHPVKKKKKVGHVVIFLAPYPWRRARLQKTVLKAYRTSITSAFHTYIYFQLEIHERTHLS